MLLCFMSCERAHHLNNAEWNRRQLCFDWASHYIM